jgi:competence protein ComEC
MDIFYQNPFLRLLLPLAAGIYAGSELINPDICSTYIIVGSIPFLLFLLLFIHRQKNYSFRWIPGFLIILILFISGWSLSVQKLPSSIEEQQPVSVYGEVLSVEVRNMDWHRIILLPKVVSPHINIKPNDKWLVMANGTFQDMLFSGDFVYLNGTIQSLPEVSNPNAFDYGTYLKRNGFSGQMFIDAESISLVEKKAGWTISELPGIAREKALSKFTAAGVDSTNLTIISALLLGDRKGIDRELSEKFIRSGAVHILAVSGLHVGILYLLLNYFLGLFLKPSHPLRIILGISFLFAYAFLTGFSPSVSRAVVMFSIIQTGKALSRTINMYNLLCSSAFILLLWNPMYLFHAGFWLSHLAVAGIVAFYPMINSLIIFRFIGLRWVWSLVSVSIAAQITTFPYSLYVFGAFPSYFLLTNISVLPVVAPILVVSIMLLIVSFIPFLALIAGGLLNSLLDFMVEMVGIIEGVPGSYFTGLWVSFPLMVLFFVSIALAYRLYIKPKGYLWVALSGSFACVALALIFQVIVKSGNNCIVVYDTGKEAMIDVIHNGNVVNLSTPELDTRSKSYAREGFLRRNTNVLFEESFVLEHEKESVTFWEVKAGSTLRRYLVVVGNSRGRLNICEALEFEGLILVGAPNFNLKEFTDYSKCEIIIAASNCPPWLKREWEAHANEIGIGFYDVRRQGAWLLSY